MNAHFWRSAFPGSLHVDVISERLSGVDEENRVLGRCCRLGELRPVGDAPAIAEMGSQRPESTEKTGRYQMVVYERPARRCYYRDWKGGWSKGQRGDNMMESQDRGCKYRGIKISHHYFIHPASG